MKLTILAVSSERADLDDSWLLCWLISLKSGPGVMTINKIGRGNFLFHKGIYLL